MAELNLRLRQAIAAARAGKVPQAKLLAEGALEEEPGDVNALLLLSALAETQEEQVDYLERILAYDPDHAIAKKRLAQLKEVPAAASETPVDELEDGGAEAATIAPTPTEPLQFADAPREVEAAPVESQEAEAGPPPGTALSEPAIAGDEALPIQDASEPQFEEVVELGATDKLTEPVSEEIESFPTDEAYESPIEEAVSFDIDEVPDQFPEEAATLAEPLSEEMEAPFSEERAESPVEESPTFETEEFLEPPFEELESGPPDEFVEPSPVEYQPFEGEELPAVFARKVEALLPAEMAEPLDEEALVVRSTEVAPVPLPENVEPLPFEEVDQPNFEAAEAFSTIEDFPADEPEDTLFEESPATTAADNFEPFSENELAAFPEEITAEEISEPYFEDTDPFPAMEEADLHTDDPMATLIADAPEIPDEAAPERFINELHDFPVEDLRKPAALVEDESPVGNHTETPDSAAAQLYEPSPGEIDDLSAEEAGQPEEKPVERPFLAVTAPLRHDVVESPPDAREGLAAQLDEELFEEEDGLELDTLIGQDSPEAGPALAATAAGLELPQDDEPVNEDVFASLVEEVTEPVTEDADRVTGFEPVAESDIPEWLREAEDSSLAADIVENESEIALREPAELNDIPAWLLDDGDEEWLESEPETRVAPATYAEESVDAQAAPGVAPEALVAAPAAIADYSDDDIDAAMATIIDDEVDVDSFEIDSGTEEPAEMYSEEAVDAVEDEKPKGKVSTRALEIFLIVLVAVAVIVLAALALVVFNPFS